MRFQLHPGGPDSLAVAEADTLAGLAEAADSLGHNGWTVHDTRRGRRYDAGQFRAAPAVTGRRRGGGHTAAAKGLVQPRFLLSPQEHAWVVLEAKALGLTLAEFARRKVLGEPLDAPAPAGRGKITRGQAAEIRAAYASGEASQQALGRRYGLSQAHVGRIVRGEAQRQR